jgi:MinD superfamily P-loop ATPase
MKLPAGVVINRAGSDDRETREYCHAEGIDILAEIPDDRQVAEIYSRGLLAAEELTAMRTRMQWLLGRIFGYRKPVCAAAPREVPA